MRTLHYTAASAIVLFGLAAPAGAVTVLTGSGTIDDTDLTQLGRVDRNGVVSTWAAPKSFPGVINPATNYNYDLVSVTFAPNATQTVFYEISYENVNSVSPFSVAYQNSFDPTSLSTNYLGDAGGSALPLTSISYQVVVLTGDQLILHSGTTAPLTSPEDYNFTVTAFSDANGDENFGATPLPATLPLFATGLGALGLLGWRRKRKAQAQPDQNT